MDMKTLLILGNGFDLALGMPSTFKKFGIYRRKQLESIPLLKWTIIDLLLESITLGFWGKENNHYNWGWWDFEKNFEETVIRTIASGDFLEERTMIHDYTISDEELQKLREAREDLVISASAQNYIFKKTQYPDLYGFIVNEKKLIDTDVSENVNFINLFLALLKRTQHYYEVRGKPSVTDAFFVDDISNYEIQKITSKNITESDKFKMRSLFPTFDVIKPILIKDLQLWETEFANYIKSCQSKLSIKNLTYDRTSSLFINHVLLDRNTVQNVQILNFNYSIPTVENYKSDESTILNYSKQLNIHGSIDLLDKVSPETSGIVIGYDYQVLLDYPEYIKNTAPFTKTFRISELNTILAKKSNSIRSDKLNYHVDKIVIVGHSLSGADDSYFRTIFDTADLYNGNVVLEYWYTDYPGRDTTLSVETENLQKINELLMRYIRTSKQVNKDNLLHKLLLENRLLLREYNINEILKG